MQNHNLSDCDQCQAATHAFCPECKTVREITFQTARGRGVKGVPLSLLKYEGGAVVCTGCDTVLVHLYREATPARNGRSLRQDALG